VGAESFRRRKFDRDKLIWNADCGMGKAECEALDPLIAAEWTDRIGKLSKTGSGDCPTGPLGLPRRVYAIRATTRHPIERAVAFPPIRD
jgi:hypothetical protein